MLHAEEPRAIEMISISFRVRAPHARPTTPGVPSSFSPTAVRMARSGFTAMCSHVFVLQIVREFALQRIDCALGLRGGYHEADVVL